MNTDKIIAEKIASEYTQKEVSKITALRKLDKKAKQPANIFAYTYGIIMTLVLGIGMCLSMGTIGDGSLTIKIVGGFVGAFGLIGTALTYFFYNKIWSTSKKKYANDIITLAKEVADSK